MKTIRLTEKESDEVHYILMLYEPFEMAGKDGDMKVPVDEERRMKRIGNIINKLRDKDERKKQ